MKAATLHQTDTVTRDELRLLIAQPSRLCVSIFLPIERVDPARQQNPIRLENILRAAEQRLMERGIDAVAARGLLEPAYELAGDPLFWAHQSGGLAIFLAADLARAYRLPQQVDELLVVDTHAHIVPLLAYAHGDGQFYLLALGLGGVQLFEGSRSGLRPLALPGVPDSLRDALAYDEFAKQAQFHPGIPGRGGERGAIFHGQGARDGMAVKQEALTYFQEVEHGVRQALRGERAPLLLAGIAYLLPIYRAANRYPQLVDDAIAVNPDDLRPQDLHARAWMAVAPHFERACPAALERYRFLRGTQPARATSSIRAIVPAAHAGRVDTLLLAMGQRRWGTFDARQGELSLHEDALLGDGELLNLAAIQTIQHDGMVYAVAPEQMPDAEPLAALLRY